MDRVELVVGDDGIRMRLRVKPGSRRQRLIGAYGGALKLEVKAPPEKGRANAAVVELIAESLAVGTGEVEITAGAGGQDKTVLVTGASARAVREALERAGVPVACSGTAT